jgi:hypothetical protein
MAQQEIAAITRTGLCHQIMGMEEEVEMRCRLWLLQHHGQAASPSSAEAAMLEEVRGVDYPEVLLLKGGDKNKTWFLVFILF